MRTPTPAIASVGLPSSLQGEPRISHMPSAGSRRSPEPTIQHGHCSRDARRLTVVSVLREQFNSAATQNSRTNNNSNNNTMHAPHTAHHQESFDLLHFLSKLLRQLVVPGWIGAHTHPAGHERVFSQSPAAWTRAQDRHDHIHITCTTSGDARRPRTRSSAPTREGCARRSSSRHCRRHSRKGTSQPRPVRVLRARVVRVRADVRARVVTRDRKHY